MERRKVIFPQKNDKGEIEMEGMWCIIDGDHCIIDNIPFIAKRVSLGDTIEVEYDADDKAYYFEDFVSVSGNTTVRIYFHDPSIITETRQQLGLLGCETEAFLGRDLVAVNIGKEVIYKPIKDYLDKGESLEKWSYEESCLAHEY